VVVGLIVFLFAYQPCYRTMQLVHTEPNFEDFVNTLLLEQ
jgi:hypothetical protein